jgi:hypothetical protein
MRCECHVEIQNEKKEAPGEEREQQLDTEDGREDTGIADLLKPQPVGVKCDGLADGEEQDKCAEKQQSGHASHRGLRVTA